MANLLANSNGQLDIFGASGSLVWASGGGGSAGPYQLVVGEVSYLRLVFCNGSCALTPAHPVICATFHVAAWDRTATSSTTAGPTSLRGPLPQTWCTPRGRAAKERTAPWQWKALVLGVEPSSSQTHKARSCFRSPDAADSFCRRGWLHIRRDCRLLAATSTSQTYPCSCCETCMHVICGPATW